MYRYLCAVESIANNISRIASRNMSDLRNLLASSEEILRQIKEVKTEVTHLGRIIENRSSSGDGIKVENEHLRRQVESYKQELINLEIANGIAQIPVSTKFENKADNCSSQQEEKPKVAQKDPAEQAVQQKSVPASAVPVPASAAPVPASATTVPPGDDKPQQPKSAKKKEKADKKTDDKSKDNHSEPPVDVGRLDFRVGKIVDIKKHPDADSLYVEQVDIGKDKPLTVVSGLVKHVSVDEMQGRLVILLCNLKPAKMRGITSEAMVMCANSPERVEVLSPPPGCMAGDLIEVEGYPRVPDLVLNPKKKIFETVQPDLKTNDQKEATYKGSPWRVSGKGPITCSTLTGANIK